MSVTSFKDMKLKEKENRKFALLQIAEDIMHENCMEDVTIRNVARKAGLSTGAIYMYFKSKEELLLTLLLRNLKKLQSELEDLKKIEDPAKALKSMALAYRSYFIKSGKYVDVFTHMADKEGKELISPKHKKELLDTLGAIFAVIEEMAAGEKMKKYLRGIPPHRLVPMVWSLAYGISQITLSTPRGEAVGFDFDQVIDDFINLFFSRP